MVVSKEMCLITENDYPGEVLDVPESLGIRAWHINE